MEVGLLFWDLGHPSSLGVCLLVKWFHPVLGATLGRGLHRYPESVQKEVLRLAYSLCPPKPYPVENVEARGRPD